MTTIIPASAPPATLLDVETLLGSRPTGSIALYLRRRKRPPAALRIDLPVAPPGGRERAGSSGPPDDSEAFRAPERPWWSVPAYRRRRSSSPPPTKIVPPPPRDPEEVARALTGLVARVTGATSAELVIYGSSRDQRASMGRHLPLLRAIHSRLSSAGFEVPRSFFVIGDHWAPVASDNRTVPDDAVGDWRPFPAAPPGRQDSGEPHSVAADPHHGPFVPIAPALAFRRARAMAALAVLAQAAAPAEPAAERGTDPTDAVRGLDGTGAGQGVGEQGRVDVLEALLRWNGALAEAGADDRGMFPSDARSVALVWSLQHRVVRDGVLMLCAWGLDAAVLAVHEATDAAAGATGERGDRGQNESADHDALRASPTSLGAATVYDTVLGSGARAPDDSALRCAVDLLRYLVACVPEPIAPPALAILAWLEWARGRGSVSAAYLDAADRIDPDYRLTRLLRAAVQHRLVPDWLGADSVAEPGGRR
jgi:hypothetical protein